MHSSKHYFRRAHEIEVNGYVLKNEIENINYIITNILQGKTYISSYVENNNHGQDSASSGQT